jgi:ATP-dependent 26S proteasome regulatory subunit
MSYYSSGNILRCIMFINEIDAFVTKPRCSHCCRKTSIEGLDRIANVTVIITMNSADALDPYLL